MIRNIHIIPENASHRRIRIIVGTILTVEASLLFTPAVFLAVFVLFIGGLAFLVSGSAATEKQVHDTFAMMLITALTPIVWTLILAASGLFLLIRRRPLVALIGCSLSIVMEGGMIGILAYSVDDLVFTPLLIVCLAISFLPSIAGIVVAVMVRKGLQVNE